MLGCLGLLTSWDIQAGGSFFLGYFEFRGAGLSRRELLAAWLTFVETGLLNGYLRVVYVYHKKQTLNGGKSIMDIYIYI